MLTATALSLTFVCDCAGGFASFPTLGLKALSNTWNFDFQQTYVGAGMICPLIVDWSIMLGSIACYVSSPTSSSSTLLCSLPLAYLCMLSKPIGVCSKPHGMLSKPISMP